MTTPVAFPLAITFGSPWLLSGLALATIPIIIHLFHKRRYRETRWAAMRFLLEASRKNTRRLRLEQLVLLAIRTLILLLLPLALARPYITSFNGLFDSKTRTHRVIVIDTSFSMGYTTGGESHFDRARRMARQIADAAGSGDPLNLVRIAGIQPPAVIARAAYRAEDVIREIDGLRMSHEPAQVLPALQTVNEILDSLPDVPDKEVILLTDFQSHSWAPKATQDQVQMQEQLRQLTHRGPLRVVDLGLTAAANVAVVDLALSDANVILGQPADFRATLQNFGDQAASALSVSLYVDGQLAQSQTVDVAANDRLQLNYQFTFAESGDHEVEVRSLADNLEIDDRRRLAVRVKQRIEVLLIDGRPSGRPSDGAAFYVDRALNPRSRDQPVFTHTRTRIHTDGELAGLELAGFDCIILCNVELFTQREAERLRAYVMSGGSLVVILGNQVNRDSYNAILYGNGNQLLPARLDQRMGNADDPQILYRFATDQLDHPVMSVYRGNPGAGLERPLVLEYFQLDTRDNPQARVVLYYDNQHPVIVESPLGLGRVALVSTACDGGRWNTLARRDGGVLVTLMNELVDFLISGHSRKRQLIVGDSISRSVSAAPLPESIEIVRPDQQTQSLNIQHRGNTAEFTYHDTDRAGFYRIKTGPPLNDVELLAVNLDPLESNLEKLQQTQIQRQILPRENTSYGTVWRNMSRSSETQQPDSTGLTRWLLYAALVLLLVEQVMSWRFDYGLLLLLILVMTTLATQLFTGGAIWGGPLLGLLCAALAIRLIRMGHRAV